MKITLNQLKKKDASIDGLKWFEDTFENQAEHTKIIKQLEKEKDSHDWILWLFRNFKLSGICRGWYSNGTKHYKQHYKNGKGHGIYIGWRSNGNKAFEYNFKNGDRHGISIVYDYNGNKSYEHNYKNGKLHGICTTYYFNGNKSYKDHYKNGKEIKEV